MRACEVSPRVAAFVSAPNESKQCGCASVAPFLQSYASLASEFQVIVR